MICVVCANVSPPKELACKLPIAAERLRMERHFHVMAGVVASLAVLFALTLSLTVFKDTNKDTTKAISKSIPHGANEQPISK